MALQVEQGVLLLLPCQLASEGLYLPGLFQCHLLQSLCLPTQVLVHPLGHLVLSPPGPVLLDLPLLLPHLSHQDYLSPAEFLDVFRLLHLLLLSLPSRLLGQSLCFQKSTDLLQQLIILRLCHHLLFLHLLNLLLVLRHDGLQAFRLRHSPQLSLQLHDTLLVILHFEFVLRLVLQKVPLERDELVHESDHDLVTVGVQVEEDVVVFSQLRGLRVFPAPDQRLQ